MLLIVVVICRLAGFQRCVSGGTYLLEEVEKLRDRVVDSGLGVCVVDVMVFAY